MSLDKFSTDDLIEELQNRKKKIEQQKKKRIQDLKSIIEKSINELNELTDSDFVITSTSGHLQKPIKKNVKSEQQTNICPQCGLGPNNWEYDKKDGKTYCECGWTIEE